MHWKVRTEHEVVFSHLCLGLCLFTMLLSYLFSRHFFNTAKEIKGSTLLLFSPDDIKYELEDLSIDDHMHLRNFLREIVSL